MTQLSTNQIASVTSKDIHKLKTIVPRSDKQRQLQVEKLEGNFKDAINRYYRLQKVIDFEQSKFSYLMIICHKFLCKTYFSMFVLPLSRNNVQSYKNIYFHLL